MSRNYVTIMQVFQLCDLVLQNQLTFLETANCQHVCILAQRFKFIVQFRMSHAQVLELGTHKFIIAHLVHKTGIDPRM